MRQREKRIEPVSSGLSDEMKTLQSDINVDNARPMDEPMNERNSFEGTGRNYETRPQAASDIDAIESIDEAGSDAKTVIIFAVIMLIAIYHVVVGIVLLSTSTGSNTAQIMDMPSAPRELIISLGAACILLGVGLFFMKPLARTMLIILNLSLAGLAILALSQGVTQTRIIYLAVPVIIIALLSISTARRAFNN